MSVRLSVSLSVTVVSPAKTTEVDEPINLPFGLSTRVGSRKHVLDGAGVYVSPMEMGKFDGKLGGPFYSIGKLCRELCKMAAEPIEITFRVGQRKQVLRGSAHWRHLLNNIKPSMCGGDAVLLYHLFELRMFCHCRKLTVPFHHRAVLTGTTYREYAFTCN